MPDEELEHLLRVVTHLHLFIVYVFGEELLVGNVLHPWEVLVHLVDENGAPYLDLLCVICMHGDKVQIESLSNVSLRSHVIGLIVAHITLEAGIPDGDTVLVLSLAQEELVPWVRRLLLVHQEDIHSSMP